MSFEVNLIKDITPPLRKRRLIFFTMVSYIAICFSIFVFLCYKVAVDFKEINTYQRRITYQEKELYRQSPELENMFSRPAEVKEQILQYIKKLETIDKILSQRINISNIMPNFYQPLPIGAYLDNISLDSDNKTLSFDVIIPDDVKGGAFNTSELISAWKDDLALMTDIENIKSSISQRSKKAEKSFFILKFSCTLFKGAIR